MVLSLPHLTNSDVTSRSISPFISLTVSENFLMKANGLSIEYFLALGGIEKLTSSFTARKQTSLGLCFYKMIHKN